MDNKFEPNEELLNQMVSMGIPQTVAIQALFCTGNQSIDEAVDYVYSTQEELSDCKTESQHIGPEINGLLDIEHVEDEEDMQYYKMIFVVNTSLKMGVGKIAAQVGHACLGLYRNICDDLKEELNHWECIGEKKIVLKGNDEVHLTSLYEKAKCHNIPCYLVRDAGHTQIAPNSITVLSLFGLEDEVNEITGKLNLL